MYWGLSFGFFWILVRLFFLGSFYFVSELFFCSLEGVRFFREEVVFVFVGVIFGVLSDYGGGWLGLGFGG